MPPPPPAHHEHRRFVAPSGRACFKFFDLASQSLCGMAAASSAAEEPCTTLALRESPVQQETILVQLQDLCRPSRVTAKIVTDGLKAIIGNISRVEDLALAERLIDGYKSNGVQAFCGRMLRLTNVPSADSGAEEVELSIPHNLRRVLDKKKADLTGEEAPPAAKRTRTEQSAVVAGPRVSRQAMKSRSMKQF